MLLCALPHPDHRFSSSSARHGRMSVAAPHGQQHRRRRHNLHCRSGSATCTSAAFSQELLNCLGALCVTLQVTLIPSDQMQYMYPYERGHLLFRRARVDLLKPDYEVRSTPLLHLQIFVNLKCVRILLSCAFPWLSLWLDTATHGHNSPAPILEKKKWERAFKCHSLSNDRLAGKAGARCVCRQPLPCITTTASAVL